MQRPLPIWSLPFILALASIAALVGNLAFEALVVIGIETLGVCAYLVVRGRGKPAAADRRPASNLVSLFPGHLLLLLILALLEDPGSLAWLWMLIPLATVAYDATARSARLSTRRRMSISMILYVILWADLFYLLERAIVLHRQLSGGREIMIAAAFGLAGVLFLSLGVYRHWIAAKE